MSLFFSSSRAEDIATADLKKGDRVKVSIRVLNPTQFAVGRDEVEEKVEKMSEMNDEELKEYRLEKRVPVVKGPNNQLYVIDHHHSVLAFREFGYNKVHVEVLEDYSKLSEKDFWEKMIEKKWVYLKDEKGVEKSYKELPKNFSELKDDPYRALAGFVRDEGGFKKTGKPFEEFSWAEVFRKENLLKDLPRTSGKERKKIFKKAVEAGIALRHKMLNNPCHIFDNK